MKRAILILSFIILTGCAPSQSQMEQMGPPPVVVNSISRWVDEQAGVVCWVYNYKGGISCLPLSDTKLDE